MKNKYRQTKQRKIILDYLNKNRCHPSADEIYDAVRVEMPHISLSTVYRNLDFLQRNGIIKAIETGGGQRRFDYNTEDHHHIRCVKCRKVEDIELDLNNDIAEYCSGKTDFEILGYDIDIYGICPACKNKFSNKERK